MSFRRERRFLFVLLAVFALLVASAPVFGQVTDNKTYTVVVNGVQNPEDDRSAAPGVFAGDSNAHIELTLKNTSTSQSIGSANVTVPAPFELVAAPDDTVSGGPVIELRSLGIAPLASRTFPMTVDVRTCTPPDQPPTFDIAVKQSNDFNGTGNDFFLDGNQTSDLQVEITGACRLAFFDQPGDAERGATITSSDYDPSGDPITVEVRDAGDTGRVTHATPTITLSVHNPAVTAPAIGGTTSATAVAGFAAFDPGPTLTPSSFGYTLIASTTAFDGPGGSDPFNVVDAQVDCPADSSCDGSTTGTNNQELFVSMGPARQSAPDASLVLSLGAADVPAFECAGYTPDPLGQVAQFFVTDADGEDAGADRVGVVSLSIPDATRPLHTYEVCWATPEQFTTDGGGDATEQGIKPGTEDTPLFVGLLPDCPRRGEPPRPCISGRDFDRRTSTLTIRIETTGADPWMRG